MTNPPSGRPGSPGPRRDTKSSLYEAALAAVQDRAEQAKARASRPSRPRRRFPLVRIMLVIGATGLVLLVLRPGWLAGPRALHTESPGVAAASLRLTLLHERGLVQEYARRVGRLPASLEEAGSTSTGLDYRRSGEGFTLAGHAGDSLIMLHSTDSMATFLGGSLTRLKNRGRELP